METRKRWHRYLILLVAFLTVYNILPTVLYYSKPLRTPIDESRAMQVAENVVGRINSLESESISWLRAFTKHLKLNPTEIATRKNNPAIIQISFNNKNEAALFRALLPTAGSLIPFVPAQLTLGGDTPQDPTTVLVQRKVGVKIDPESIPHYFHFVEKLDQEGRPTEQYKQLVYDRVDTILQEIVGESVAARQIQAILANPNDSRLDELAITLAKQLSDVSRTFGDEHPIAQRYFATFTKSFADNADQFIPQYTARLKTIQQRMEGQAKALEAQQKASIEADEFFDPSQQHALQSLTASLAVIEEALAVLHQNADTFSRGLQTAPLTQEELTQRLRSGTIDPKSGMQQIDLSGQHPYFDGATLDWTDDLLTLSLHDDVQTLREGADETEISTFLRDKLNRLLISEVARISRETDESITPHSEQFAVALGTLTGSGSLLVLDLGELANDQAEHLVDTIQTSWNPTHPDLQSSNYPINTWATYETLSVPEQRLGVVVYSPTMDEDATSSEFRDGSMYVIARGMQDIVEKYRNLPEDEQASQFMADFNALAELLASQGFIGRPGTAYGLDGEYSRDYIFELSDFYSNLVNATREDFIVKGNKHAATLEFSDVEQRILADNRIDDQIHEDLLKWKEEYNTAQVALNPALRYNVPPPTKSSLWENLKLSARKYFRGDDRKILRWGLDLSGGKTVRIGLRDHNGEVVKNPEDIKQAVDELYNRINKMGVAERNIRVENNNIILEFPGSQGLSASDLVKASAMYFHIVNEKFSPSSPLLGAEVDAFLQEVWEEAVVTKRTQAEEIHSIAWEHLGGDEEGAGLPRSEAARILYENGLRLANPQSLESSNAFNDRVSRVARFRGDDRSEWHSQTHPLLILFNNYALEGAALTNVMAGYDPKSGNLLNFNIKRSYDKRQGSPRDDFYTWTSQYAQDKVIGTPKEQASSGHGWRLAVVLNDEVISAPELKAALRDGGNITGRFSQREINKLVSDLKAGSLTFTPKILSEHNISPELGKTERQRGITAAAVGFLLVVAAMVYVYRFAGAIASVALLFNLFIIWAVLQNIDAALSLPGIAAIVLTMGMAVDANVLVFERTREEFKQSGRIASALQAGYRKAFSAIIDSNLTTIIAALILIQFDSGPIKGFAITLIIGIAASMFSALFMTRYFFAGWVAKGKERSLNMVEFLTKTKINFLSWARPALIGSGLLLIAGSFFLVDQRNTLFGMDFTGGYALSVDIAEESGRDYRTEATQALIGAGATSTDLQVQELSRSNQLRIQLGTSMEEEGRPFHGMPEELERGTFDYEWQKNPRIAWVVDALQTNGIQLQEEQIVSLSKNWTSMSGQFSDAMRNNALIALSAALACILLYITFRFEFKYAVSAVIGLTHDVIATLGILAILHWIGLPVQIDLQVVGAIMTIIGYSLNDTIIVFDRVREDLQLYRKLSFSEVVNQALNTTLSRTVMTSLTTLLVLLSLVLLGGASIFTFSLVMTIGVVVGTLSTLFVASPALVWLHDREQKKIEQLNAVKVV